MAADQGNSNEDGPAKNGLFSQLKDKLHDLICSAVEPLTTFANRSNKTQALGFNVSGALGLFNGVAGSYGVQVAADPTGGVALIINASGNPGFPPVFALGGMGGAAYTQSTAQTVNDLTGPSTVASFSISPEGAGPTIGLDLATSPSATSTTVSYGPGFGAKYAVTSAAGGTKIIAGTSCP